jgi:phosphatidylinositol kinase/protein kinase (PI-3  family)
MNKGLLTIRILQPSSPTVFFRMLLAKQIFYTIFTRHNINLVKSINIFMELTFNLLLTLLLEIPIVGFFFKKRKRRTAYLVCLFVNLVTWPIINIIRLKTEWDLNLVEIAVVIAEGFGYWFILNCGWKKATIITIVSNIVSFVLVKLVHFEPDILPKKIDIIR